MPSAPVIKSYWRKLVDSLRENAGGHVLPEYRQHEERSHNYRYYR